MTLLGKVTPFKPGMFAPITGDPIANLGFLTTIGDRGKRLALEYAEKKRLTVSACAASNSVEGRSILFPVKTPDSTPSTENMK